MASVLLIKSSKSKFRGTVVLTPPLGIMYLIAYAKKHRKSDVFHFHDERTDPLDETGIEQLIKRTKPDIIGLSALTVEGIHARSIAKAAKKTRPEAKILIGGPYASSFGEQLLQDNNIDYVFVGESEISFLRFLEAFDKGEEEPAIPNVSYRLSGGGVKPPEPMTELIDMASLPTPAWEYIEFEKYDKPPNRMNLIARGNYAALYTSRGCPYRCTFCHNIFGKKFRAMPSEKVVAEIEEIISRFGVSDFEIVDDIFNLDYDRAMKVFDEIINRGLKVRLSFPNGIRGDIMDETFIKKMRKAGTVQMSFAPETASPRLQKMIRKNIDLDKIRENISIAAREGIFTMGFFMLGFPGETREEMLSTIKFALDSDLQGAHFVTVVYQEGTDLKRQVAGEEANYKDIELTDYFITENKYSAVSAAELNALAVAAHFLLYYSPRRMITIYRNNPYGFDVLVRYAMRLTFGFPVKSVIHFALPKIKEGLGKLYGKEVGAG